MWNQKAPKYRSEVKTFKLRNRSVSSSLNCMFVASGMLNFRNNNPHWETADIRVKKLICLRE